MAKLKSIQRRGKEHKHQHEPPLIEWVSKRQMAANLTFVDMLREQLEVRRSLKLPQWLKFLLPYQRRDQACLSAADQQRFLCALNVLIADGTYGKLVDTHAEM